MFYSSGWAHLTWKEKKRGVINGRKEERKEGRKELVKGRKIKNVYREGSVYY